ncbi:MAG: hypothetical protein LBG88_02805 [Christensenellaceae bacterium]|jgi:hypothetical protein|nr:hypothetical protein [Christensenellaceae bacterium]
MINTNDNDFGDLSVATGMGPNKTKDLETAVKFNRLFNEELKKEFGEEFGSELIAIMTPSDESTHADIDAALAEGATPETLIKDFEDLRGVVNAELASVPDSYNKKKLAYIEIDKAINYVKSKMGVINEQ